METPTFFPDPASFREWLIHHHESAEELWVGYYKKATGLPSMTWEESVYEALCFGWIDGIRKKEGEQAYKIRFTPRRPNSVWSAKNIGMMESLLELDLVAEAGIKAFERRKDQKSRQYSYENRDKAVMPPEYIREIKKHPDAWEFYQQLAPGYRKSTIWWVVSAKQEVTRKKRLQVLIESSSEGKKIPMLRRNGK